jgi:hypothetical protein
MFDLIILQKLNPVLLHGVSTFQGFAVKILQVCVTICRTRWKAGDWYYSDSLMFKPADLLATQIAPIAVLSALSSRDFYFRASHSSLPPCAPDMLTVRFGQLTVRGLAPLKIRSLVGCSDPFSSSSEICLESVLYLYLKKECLLYENRKTIYTKYLTGLQFGEYFPALTT